MKLQNKYPHALKQGTTLKQGTYTIDKVLGAGGFGVTYMATQKPATTFEDPRQVVVKELFINADKDYFSTRNHSNNTVIPQSLLVERYTEFKERFKNEAATLHKFRNLEGTINVLDYFEENETAYFTMAYIEAQTLTDVVKLTNGLPLDQALDYIKQVGEVLTALHKENVMHRDIKPDNILIDANNKVYLIDFGIAKQYDETGIVTKITGMGTNRYAPPEQLAGIKNLISFAMDVFGLANTLYFMLTANDPQTSQEEEIYGKKTVLDFCPNISTTLNEAIEKSRLKHPHKRTQSVETFLKEIFETQFINKVVNNNTNKTSEKTIIKNEQTIIERDSHPIHNNTLADPDGNTYKTVTIGNQTWMAENLNLDVGRGCWCYNDEQANCDKYGKLYTWDAAKRAADKIPGWHLPTDEEWKQLEMYLGMSKSDAEDIGVRGNIAKKLKSTSGWYHDEGNDNNSSGFFALPGGYRSGYGGNFHYLGSNAYFWIASAYSSGYAWRRNLHNYHSGVNRSNSHHKANGYSVRLVRD